MSGLVATSTTGDLLDLGDLQGHVLYAIALNGRFEYNTLDSTALVSPQLLQVRTGRYLQIEAHTNGITSYEEIVVIVWVVE